VQFFATCLVELLRPDVGTAAQRVLRATGHDPQPVRGATCCGQPAYNAGYAREARRVARRTLRALSYTADAGDSDSASYTADGAVRPCVVASGSCATMMSHHWPALFEGTADAEAARRVAARTVELTAFLTRAPAPTAGGEAGSHSPDNSADTGAGAPRDAAEPAGDSADPGSGTSGQSRSADGSFDAGTGTAAPSDAGGVAGSQPASRADEAQPAQTAEETQTAQTTETTEQAGRADEAQTAEPGAARVVVHDSCHALRELGAGVTVRQALTHAGHTPVDPAGTERCCGFGGSFSVKLPEVSVTMADEKLDSFAATGCAQVTSCDLSCLLHLQGRARRRGLGLRFDHVATLLDRCP